MAEFMNINEYRAAMKAFNQQKGVQPGQKITRTINAQTLESTNGTAGDVAEAPARVLVGSRRRGRK